MIKVAMLFDFIPNRSIVDGGERNWQVLAVLVKESRFDEEQDPIDDGCRRDARWNWL
jgi:hypothetical protein